MRSYNGLPQTDVSDRFAWRKPQTSVWRPQGQVRLCCSLATRILDEQDEENSMNSLGERESSDEDAVRHVVRQMNELWLSKRYDEIGELLSEHAVIAPPGSGGRVHGRSAYVQSYRDYDQAAATHEFSPGEAEIDIVGDVAVAVCPFFVVHEMQGKTHREQGRDVLVLSRTTGKWSVVWRTMLTESSEESASQTGTDKPA
ncbi:MAG: DUF4440 domain-containing protein [Gemmatimonadales bacterium]|nr:MAG: DUF4440 domain-containing protein [Gemmatimonadales bacterium]